MKALLLTFLLVIASFAISAETEGDLQLPVSDVSQLTRQEQQQTPTLDEVEMTQAPKPNDPREELRKKVNHSKPWTSY